MDPHATVPRRTYEFSLAAALRGIDVPHFVAVHGVEDVDARASTATDSTSVRDGNLRDELLWVTWDQDLGRDAAYVVIGATDLDALDDRGYREAQLQAGIVEGRLHIAAYALGHRRVRDDVPGLRDRGAARRAARGTAFHLRRRAVVPHQGRRAPRASR